MLHQAHVLWPWFVAMLPAAGVLFALDGVLIGAGDVAFMRTITIVAAVGFFAPLNLGRAALALGDRRGVGRADRVRPRAARGHGRAHPRRPVAGARRWEPAMPDGLVIVDKPAGWTSHDVVARMRRLAGTRKVGHAGTLDPMATGVLVLGVGRATRLLHHLVLADKEYSATVRLGAATITDDAEGEIVSTAPTASG